MQLRPAAKPLTYADLPGSITSVHKTYHHRPGEQPTLVENTWERRLTTRGRPVVRDLLLGREWVRVDCAGISHLALANRRPPRATIPTPEERAAEEAPVVEVGVGSPPTALLRVPVGEGVEFTPASPQVWLRARAGTADVVLTEYPL